ncbi:MAG: hypothetical protein K2X27_19215 [Candidatus Obscuribacterales bacterium]|nr:hypothetical protein [Candidatus Obscuribacterales bacterium]
MSSSKMSQLLEISQSTAWVILRKLASLKDLFPGWDLLLCRGIELSSAVCKRSRETPARRDPRFELQDSSEIEPLAISNITVIEPECSDLRFENSNFSDDSDEWLVKVALSNEPRSFDSLCAQTNLPVSRLNAALTFLELDGTATRCPGDKYVLNTESKLGRSLPQENLYLRSRSDSVLISDFVSWIRKTFHGVSFKYLQTYMAAYAFKDLQSLNSHASFLETCLKAPPLSYSQLIEYVSDLVLALPYLRKVE